MSSVRSRRRELFEPPPPVTAPTDGSRRAENAQIFDFTVTDEDITELDRLDRTGGTGTALENRWWRA